MRGEKKVSLCALSLLAGPAHTQQHVLNTDDWRQLFTAFEVCLFCYLAQPGGQPVGGGAGGRGRFPLSNATLTHNSPAVCLPRGELTTMYKDTGSTLSLFHSEQSPPPPPPLST
ncbi:unnamed protein product [Arctogadus glacialis]